MTLYFISLSGDTVEHQILTGIRVKEPCSAQMPVDGPPVERVQTAVIVSDTD